MPEPCNPVLVSECVPTTTCDSCKEIIKSHCIKYTGEYLANLDISEGDTLNEILIKLNELFNT